MGRALDAAPAGPDVHSQLAAAALHALRGVVAGPADRRVALDLLAADALLTAACEAAAEIGPEAVDRLVADLDPTRFASILPPDAG